MTKQDNTIFWIIGIAVIALLLIGPRLGLFSTQVPNPASVYCEKQGGTLEIRTNPDGQIRPIYYHTGYCIFSDGSECEEWAFYRGECSPITKEETVCCKITIVYPEAKPTYTWQKESYCSNIINGKPLFGTSRMIVDGSYCEEQEKCLFTINDYCIKLWMLLIGLGGILLIIILSKKK